MAIVRTDDTHYAAIAEALRQNLGSTDKFTPAKMPAGVAEVHKAGETAEKARCAAKHFSTTLVGNGKTAISFHVPFEPDYLTVFCSDSDVYNEASNVIYTATFDLSCFGFIAGVAYATQGNGITGQLMTSTSIHNRYSRAEDGTVTLQNIGSVVSSFFSGRPYAVIAMKYIDKTDKERITQYIRSLGSSGKATLNQAKVNAAFTDAEWAALIAEKPGWTFSFI